MEPQIQVVKIGTECVLGKNGLHDETIKMRAKEMQEIDSDEGIKTILVVSGAIGLGKAQCGNTEQNEDLSSIELQRYACIGQPALVRFYANAFEDIYNVSQLLVTSKDLEKEGHVRDRIMDDVKNDIVTLINYNDGIDFEELRQDNDTLAATVAKYINAKRLILLGKKYDGMLDSNKKLIEKVDYIDDNLYKMCNGVSNNGTGGFEVKLDAAKMLMEAGIEMIISNINYDLRDVVAGRVPRTLFRND